VGLKPAQKWIAWGQKGVASEGMQSKYRGGGAVKERRIMVKRRKESRIRQYGTKVI